jgi:hypothetical protein
MSCLLIIAGVCLMDAQNIEISEWSSVGRWAAVQVGEATVEVQLSSDNLVQLDPRHMKRACTQEACLSYWKWCESAGEQLTCHYSTDGRTIAP